MKFCSITKKFSFSLGLLLLNACRDSTQIPIEAEVLHDTITLGCLASFEILPSGETINKIYGKNSIKQGHWIRYEMCSVASTADERMLNSPRTLVKTRMEEGYYRNNKKEKVWKFFNIDATLKDSVTFKGDLPVTHWMSGQTSETTRK